MKILFLNVMAALAISSFSFASDISKKNAEIKDNNKNFLMQEKLNRQVPGTDGAGGGESNPQKTIETYDEDDDFGNSWWDSYHIMEEEAVINGTLPVYWYGSDSEDWFRFTVYQRAKYTFSFYHFGNRGYGFALYNFKFRPGDLIDSKIGENVEQYELKTGTYYIQVYNKNVGQYASVNNYRLSFIRSYISDEVTVSNIQESSNKQLLLWRPEFLPDYAKNMMSSKVLLSEGGVVYFGDQRMEEYYPRYGYMDPIFINGIYDGIVPHKYLDSILYIWNHDDLCFLSALFEALEMTLNSYERKDPIKELQFRLDQYRPELIEAGAELVISVVAVFAGETAGKVLGAIGVVSAFVSLVKTVIDMLSFKMPNEVAVEYIRIGSHITELKSNCMKARDYPNDWVLKLPKYAYLSKEYKNGVPSFYWNSAFGVYEANRTNFYAVRRTEAISSTQSFRDSTYYNALFYNCGNFSRYNDLRDLIAKTGYSFDIDFRDTPVSNDSSKNYIKLIDEDTVYNYPGSENSGNENQGNGEQNPPVPDQEPELTTGVSSFKLSEWANFEENSINVSLTYYDPNDDISGLRLVIDDNELSRIYNLEKTEVEQTLYGSNDDNQSIPYFDFTNGEEYNYVFSYVLNGNRIVGKSGTIVFKDIKILADHYEHHDAHDTNIGIEGPIGWQPGIDIGGGSKPWVIDGGITGPDKPWIGGGIGGGGFGGGLGGGGY